jgi:hypothetical protein
MVLPRFLLIVCPLILPLAGGVSHAEVQKTSCGEKYSWFSPRFAASLDRVGACRIVRASGQAAIRADIEKKLPARPVKIDLERLKILYAKMCGASIMAMPIQNLIYVNLDRSNEFAAHYSNFVGGLNFMMIFHSCMTTLTPAEKSQVLHMVLSMNMAGNAFFELGGTSDLDFLGIKSGSQTRRKGDDWGDFAAGGAATALYYLLIRSIESAYQVKLSEGC